MLHIRQRAIHQLPTSHMTSSSLPLLLSLNRAGKEGEGHDRGITASTDDRQGRSAHGSGGVTLVTRTRSGSVL